MRLRIAVMDETIATLVIRPDGESETACESRLRPQ